MKYNRYNRRMFLQGSGALFAIPFLESLIPRALAQTMTPPIRYIQIVTPYNFTRWDFFTYTKPDGTAARYGDNAFNTPLFKGVTADPTGNCLYTPLSNIQLPLVDGSRQLSRMLGPELTALRSKFTVIRGLDMQGTTTENPPTGGNLSAEHNTVYPSCASPNKFIFYYCSPQFYDQE
jgi:hypothetical protein